MYTLITSIRLGNKSASVIVDNADVEAAAVFFEKNKINILLEPFEEYEDAFYFKLSNDSMLTRQPACFDPYYLENILSNGLGAPKKFIERNLRFGYNVAVGAVFDLIEKAEKAGAIQERLINTSSPADCAEESSNLKTVFLKIDTKRINNFDIRHFVAVQNTADNLQHVLFDVDTSYGNGIIGIESFNEPLYQKEDLVEVKEIAYPHVNESCLAGFNFKNESFFNKMAGIKIKA